MMRFLGITREAIFSPGRVDDDAAILLAVADALRSSGNSVETIRADDDRWPEPTTDTTVFTMAQGDRSLARLQEWERRGLRVINRSQGILNCQRHRTVPLLTEARVEFPTSLLVATRDAVELPPWIEGGAWVKRGDVHATEVDDVVFVESAQAVHEALARFAARAIERAVVQHHAPGTVLKFYAVLGSFFHCVGGSELPAAVLARIDALGQQAAQALGVEIYGGDCVYDVNGGLTLIDLNDWPSYARCRFAAASAIAAYVETSKAAST
jgi:glutathione synthase/RimK-type ligase-like ATP-grasp enzyme